MQIDSGKSFFVRLPYDVRAIIYSHLEPENLPPLAPGLGNPGFLLSCRQAHQELSEVLLQIATKRLDVFIAKFRANADIPNFELITTPRDIRSITVKLPFFYFYTQDGRVKEDIRRQVIKCLEPLFAQCFDVVRIHIGDKEGGCVPPHDTLLSRGRIEVNMHRLMRDVIARMIDRQRDFGAENMQDSQKVYLSAHIKTRRICLSWDLCGDEGAPQSLILNGDLHHSRNIGRESYAGTALLHGLTTQQTRQDIDPWRYQRTVFYYLRDSQRLMGQMCLQSYRRWTSCEGLFLNEVINGQETDREYVSSIGLGASLEKGLHGISEEEYEKQEREIEAVLWP